MSVTSEAKLALQRVPPLQWSAEGVAEREPRASLLESEGASVMESWYAAPRSGERFILTGRVLLALLSVLSVVVEEGRRSTVLLPLLAVIFLIYAVFLFITTRRVAADFRHQFTTHILDLVFFSLFTFLTRGSLSPVYAFFFFSLLCSAIRFRVRGTVWTAVAVVTIYTAIGGLASLGGAVELKQLVVRSGHMAVVAGLLIYLAAYLSRLHAELSGLAAWPRVFSRDERELVHECLRRSSQLLSVSRAIMVWTEEEEPWLYVATWVPDDVDLTREEPGVYEPIVDESLMDRSFFCPDADDVKPRLLYQRSDDSRGECSSIINSALRDRFGIQSVLSVALTGETIQGRLLFVDREDVGTDDIRLAEILGRLIAARMDHFHLARQAERSAIAEERVRLARELHDGLLQSLTAASLQLEAARRLVGEDALRANELLAELHDDITRDYEELRTFIRDLRPAAGNEPDFRLHARLTDLSALVKRQWGVGVELRLDSLDTTLSRSWKKEVYRLIREAVVNASKHAQANHVIVDTKIDNGRVEITVADDGSGFPFYGTFDLRELTEMEAGPRTLKERITWLNGELKLTSTESGALLRMTLPIRTEKR